MFSDMMIGYARVSTLEQHLDLQLDALKAAGCEKTFSDKGVSGVAVNKPGLAAALDFARHGDTLVIWRLDRLSRNLGHLIEIVRDFEARGFDFQSLQENIETASPYGRLFFHMMGALAQFELDALKERTLAGIVAARNKGRRMGRPPTINDEEWRAIKDLLATGGRVASIATLRGVSRQAIYYRLGQEVSDEQFTQLAEEIRLGADRTAVIARMGLFEPAVIYRERRAAAEAA
jgi:DNA invertase Pin-like site-specific DNA recombinase